MSKTAVEIMRDFHTLDDKGRAAVMAGTVVKGNLAEDIAALPEEVRAGVEAAMKQDFSTSGVKKDMAGLSPDERVAETLPSHPFRSGASIPDGIKLDAAGLATEVEVPAADAASKASLSGVPDGTSAKGKPTPAVGDKVTVKGTAGEIVAVENGVATKILLADGTEVTDVDYLFVDSVKAKQDK